VADKTPRKAPPKRAKKAWQPPKVKSGQLFESNSLACGKVFPPVDEQNDQCGMIQPQLS
jgi:hypothetical protein